VVGWNEIVKSYREQDTLSSTFTCDIGHRR
jgi:hypothetical protein